MDEFFNQGYELADSIIGQEGKSISFPAEDEDISNAVRFLDGVIQRFEDCLHSIQGVRASMNFLEAIKNHPDYDPSGETYRGVRLAHATSFWPHGKMEIVAGLRR